MAANDERPPSLGEGIRTGLGILGAFKEAIEETLQEAVERGDLAPERATRAMKDAARRFQETIDETRERMEPASRRELEALRAEVNALRDRIARLEGGDGPGEVTPSGIIVTDGD